MFTLHIPYGTRIYSKGVPTTYILSRQVAQGGFWTIFEGSTDGGARVAVRLRDPDPEHIERIRRAFQIQAWGQSRVVQTFEFFEAAMLHEPSGRVVGPYWAMVLEYIPDGSLFDLLRSMDQRQAQQNVLWALREMALALGEIHSNDRDHGDPSSKNFLIAERGGMAELRAIDLDGSYGQESSVVFVYQQLNAWLHPSRETNPVARDLAERVRRDLSTAATSIRGVLCHGNQSGVKFGDPSVACGSIDPEVDTLLRSMQFLQLDTAAQVIERIDALFLRYPGRWAEKMPIQEARAILSRGGGATGYQTPGRHDDPYRTQEPQKQYPIEPETQVPVKAPTPRQAPPPALVPLARPTPSKASVPSLFIPGALVSVAAAITMAAAVFGSGFYFLAGRDVKAADQLAGQVRAACETSANPGGGPCVRWDAEAWDKGNSWLASQVAIIQDARKSAPRSDSAALAAGEVFTTQYIYKKDSESYQRAWDALTQATSSQDDDIAGAAIPAMARLVDHQAVIQNRGRKDGKVFDTLLLDDMTHWRKWSERWLEEAKADGSDATLALAWRMKGRSLLWGGDVQGALAAFKASTTHGSRASESALGTSHETWTNYNAVAAGAALCTAGSPDDRLSQDSDLLYKAWMACGYLEVGEYERAKEQFNLVSRRIEKEGVPKGGVCPAKENAADVARELAARASSGVHCSTSVLGISK